METEMRCPTCGGTVKRTVLEKYEDDLIGIGRPVALINSVFEERCEKCDFTQIVVPDLDGLIAAIAASRALHPLKLRGEELRFMRKALEVSARDLADVVGVTQETMSRWENNHDPISPTVEKLLRLIIGGLLSKKAPAIDFDVKTIADMKIVPVCSDAKKPLMCFERLKMR